MNLNSDFEVFKAKIMRCNGSKLSTAYIACHENSVVIGGDKYQNIEIIGGSPKSCSLNCLFNSSVFFLISIALLTALSA